MWCPKNNIKRVALCGIVTVGVLVHLPSVCAQRPKDVGKPNVEVRKPNVVLIMADDVSWEAFGCYGAEDYRTPNIDALAKQGVRFAHCYSTPICTPSRVEIMTGQYSFRNYTHFGYLSPEVTRRSVTSCNLQGIRRRSQASGSSMACITISRVQTTRGVPSRQGFTNRICGR